MASSSTSLRMIELAAKISCSVAELQSLLSAQGLPSLPFDEDNAVLDATAELHELLLEPMSAVLRLSAISNLVNIDAICRFGIADMIPAGGQISFAEIAEKTPLDEALMRRLLRYSMTTRTLKEPEPGRVAHTKTSEFLTLPYINAWVRIGAADGWPASARMVDAMEKWPSSESSNETMFAEDPEQATRFAASMRSFDHFSGWAIAQAPKLYDWASLGDARVADVGGSQGHVAIELAKSFEDPTFLVQDMEMVVNDAQVPEELDGRVEFAPQPVAADVYFLSLLFHN
ncbi:hypothetical protein F5Y07DRAFT_386591 [Xylaria sp. FL0933]|nr:hypothetical protein F5Y07DRAFT_386591 [Xylaria sp. FL0933]